MLLYSSILNLTLAAMLPVGNLLIYANRMTNRADAATRDTLRNCQVCTEMDPVGRTDRNRLAIRGFIGLAHPCAPRYKDIHVQKGAPTFLNYCCGSGFSRE